MYQLKPAIRPFSTQSDLINQEWCVQRRQVLRDHSRPMRDFCRRQPPRQCQMKAEFFHDVRITPLRQQSILTVGQSGLAATVNLGLVCRGAEGIEFPNASLCNVSQAIRVALRRQSEKPTQGGEGQTITCGWRQRHRQRTYRPFQCVSRHATSQSKRRLQGPVKAIFPWCHRDVTQTGYVRLNSLAACHNVPSQPSGSKICQWAGGWNKIDRKSRV